MNCYLCGKSNLRVIRKKLRYDIRRNVLECQNCGLVYLQPNKKNLREYYDKEYRKLYTPVIGKSLNSGEIFKIYFPYQKEKIERIKNILNPRLKVLDIGCSTGHFLYAIKKYVGECVGIELNKKNANFARKKTGIKIYTKPIESINFPPNYFDLICAFDVIEHIENPINFLKVINKYLKPGGYLYLETPNLDDALISVYKIEPYCDFWFREPHLSYFSPETFLLLLKKTGFKGKVKTFQRYNFLNQINWILKETPQARFELATGKPILVKSESVGRKIKKEFNQWFQSIDKEYGELLKKHNLADNLFFIGKKAK